MEKITEMRKSHPNMEFKIGFDGYTPLMSACQTGDYKSAAKILKERK